VRRRADGGDRAAGGEVSFPESLLHAVSRVTEGRRYAFLPFLYDDAAAKVREINNQFLGDGLGSYKSQPT
jgi:predicted 2-oxoglutarate/Fe(II)-dependent dioxygenase YbiX